MADGMAKTQTQTQSQTSMTNVEVVRFRRAGGIAYAYAPNGERTTPFAGNLNIAAKKEKFALAPWRVGRFMFTANRQTDTTFFLQAVQGSISLFNVGSGGAYTLANGGVTGTASDAESMAGAEGAIVRNGASFIAVGLEIVREEPWFTLAEDAADQLGNRDWPDWFSDNGPNGFTYPYQLQRMIEEAAFFRYQLFPNTLVEQQNCGALADWMARSESSKWAFHGNFPLFTSEYGSGGQKTSSQIQATINLGGGTQGSPARVIRIAERLGLTLPATGTVVLPYAMRLWGYTVCGDPPDDDVCAIPGASSQSLGVLSAYARQLQDMMNQGMIDRAMFERLLMAAQSTVGQLQLQSG